MIEPIHIQTNILATTEQAREAQGLQTALAGSQAAQAERARKAHQEDATKPPVTLPDQAVENREEGSASGHAWLRQKGEGAKQEEEKKEEEGKGAEPGKGEKLDLKG